MARRRCAVCREPKLVSAGSLPEGQFTCRPCRVERRAEIEANRPVWPEAADQAQLNTNQKGLGWAHKRAVDELKRRHIDGSSCDWCGRPMWLNAALNWDYDASRRGSGVLHGDHSGIARSQAIKLRQPIPLPNRLLHGKCNIQRGDGSNDHLAWCNHRNRCATRQLAWLDAT